MSSYFEGANLKSGLVYESVPDDPNTNIRGVGVMSTVEVIVIKAEIQGILIVRLRLRETKRKMTTEPLKESSMEPTKEMMEPVKKRSMIEPKMERPMEPKMERSTPMEPKMERPMEPKMERRPMEPKMENKPAGKRRREKKIQKMMKAMESLKGRGEKRKKMYLKKT